MAKSVQNGTVANVQALRALAALSVAYFHATLLEGLLPLPFGRFGVDIFFIISGFIVSLTAVRDPSQFLLKRIIRVVPLYWLATFSLFLMALGAPLVLRNTPADGKLLLFSLLFIPGHRPEPLLSPGWTLNYEMYFYLLLAASLWATKKHAWLVALTAIAACVLVESIWSPGFAFASFYGQPIVLEFALGMLVAQAYTRLPHRDMPRQATGAAFLLLFACAASVTSMCVDELMTDHIRGTGVPRLLFAGLPATLLLAGVLGLERRFGLFVKNPILLLLGDASYAIYLCHLFVIDAATRLLFRGAVHWSLPSRLTLVLFLLALTCAVAVAIHLLIERSLLRLLRRKLLQKPISRP